MNTVDTYTYFEKKEIISTYIDISVEIKKSRTQVDISAYIPI